MSDGEMSKMSTSTLLETVSLQRNTSPNKMGCVSLRRNNYSNSNKARLQFAIALKNKHLKSFHETRIEVMGLNDYQCNWKIWVSLASLSMKIKLIWKYRNISKVWTHLGIFILKIRF